MSLYIPQMGDTVGVTIPGLASNFNLLAGSRIVEHGSNENGEYVRWENGLQIVWTSNLLISTRNNSNHMRGYWNFPSKFINANYLILFTPISSAGASNFDVNSFFVDSVDTTRCRCNLTSQGLFLDDGRIYVVAGVAIGRWRA